MKRGVFLVALFLIPIVCAQEYSQNEYVIIDVNLDAKVNMNYKTSNAKLESFEAELDFIPRNYLNQEIVFLNTNSEPRASIRKGDNLDYRWSLNGEKFYYGFESRVKVKNSIIKIDKEIDFPITGLKEEDLIYTKATEFVDISPKIKEKANEIVSGEDDLFSAVVALAEWTRLNVKYDLNTLTETVVQKSSWVLATREGVCDEITNLFISFLRSLNIPTKYVSGIAYSSSIDGWGPHAWAEVYFPKYGWVPFDVTFGQYGWIDPGHVKMREGKDAKEPSVVYNWRSVDVEIENKEFNISAELIENGENVIELVELEINVLKNNVKGGSYLPVEVKIKNLQDYYLSTLVFFTIAPEIINGNEKIILLGPKQEKSLYWIFKIEDVKDKNKYMAILEVGDSFGSKTKGSFEFSNEGESFSLNEIEEIVEKLEKKEEKKYKYNLFLDCSLDKNSYYEDEDVSINCEMRNNGNTVLNFDLCFENCEKISLSIAEESNKNFSLKANENKILNINAKNEKLNLENNLELRVYNEPEVNFDLKYENLRYDEKGEYDLLLDIKPEVYDLRVKISGSKDLRMDKFYGKQQISIPFKAWRIRNNEIKLVISYKDRNGKIYGKEEKYRINIGNIPFKDKFLVYFRDMMSFV